MTDKNVEIAARTTQKQIVGELIHKLSNSLVEAAPGSAEETRLISKIAAFRTDYCVYEDEIAALDRQIQAEKYALTSKTGKYDYFTQPNYSTNTTKPCVNHWDNFTVVDASYPTSPTATSSGNYTYIHTDQFHKSQESWAWPDKWSTE